MTDAVLKALRAKALPSDVRKVPDLPILGSKYWGYAQFGAQPPRNDRHRVGGAWPPPHIKRQSRVQGDFKIPV